MQRRVTLHHVKCQVKSIQLTVARDEFITQTYSPHFLEGNKFWKAQFLLQQDSKISTIYSHGGYQSNAMLSLAQLCKLKNFTLNYITQWPSKAKTPFIIDDSNYGTVTSREYKKYVNLIECTSAEEYQAAITSAIQICGSNNEKETKIFIKQGIADKRAEVGIIDFAKRLEEAITRRNQVPFDATNQKKILLIIPSGTGTSAFYLSKHFPSAHIVTVPIHGTSAKLLKQQVLELTSGSEEELNQVKNWQIIEPQIKSRRERTFAHLSLDYLQLYHDFLNQGVELDLIYAPLTIKTVLQQFENLNQYDVYYVHTGGTSGNKSMLQRYQRNEKLKM